MCSLENQSLKNLELVFIDDYSTDNSIKKIKKYMEKDNRIKLIKNNNNKGVFRTRYLGQYFQKEHIYISWILMIYSMIF